MEQVPDGDILIHAGDFTQFGKEEHAEDFNRWLGEQPHKTKLVVLGNHEALRRSYVCWIPSAFHPSW